MARRTRLVTLSIAVHLAIGLALYIAGIWRLERLEGVHAPLAALGVMAPPNGGGSPPPLPAQRLNRKPPKRVVRVLVQPVLPVEPQPVVEVPHEAAVESGTGASSGTGTGTSDGAGDGDGPPCDEQPCGEGSGGTRRVVVPPVTRRIVAPTILASLRISGNTQIMPSRATLADLMDAGLKQITARFQICIAATGAVESATLLASSRFRVYDQRLHDEMLHWRYRPYQVDGRAIEACGTVTFVYNVPQLPR